MRLVYISNARIPSSAAGSLQIMKMCQAFAKNGHEVILLAPDKSITEKTTGNPYDFYGIDKCFEITKLFCKYGSHVYGLLAAWKAKRLKPDIVDGRFITGCFFCALLGLKSVFESHAPVRDFSGFTNWAFTRLVLKRLKRVVVTSNALERYYVDECKVPRRLLMVAHNGADVDKSSELIKFQNSKRLQVGYVGHLYPGKGMEIIEPLVSKAPWAYFHIIGGTESDVVFWKEKLAKFDNVKFYGFMPHPQTHKYRRSFDVLLAPQTDILLYEGKPEVPRWMSPIKILEYMSAGKPILASDLPVSREVLKDRTNAILCDPDNIESWISALEQLRDHPDLAARLGTVAKEEFEIKYTWEMRARRILENIAS